MLKKIALIAITSAALAACGTVGGGPPSPPAPIAQPKPGPPEPKPFSQSDAETACVVQGARKFALPIGDITVSESKPVDAGYRVRLNAGGVQRTCIIAKDGFIRSLR